jgi:S-adenosylmethionine decarboxylase proenzyme
MLAAARKGKATIVQDVFHQFSPHGVSGVVVISESHFAIHTWPEYGYAAVDLFTCTQTIQVDEIEIYLRTAFNSRQVERVEILRGRLPSN